MKLLRISRIVQAVCVVAIALLITAPAPTHAAPPAVNGQGDGTCWHDHGESPSDICITSLWPLLPQEWPHLSGQWAGVRAEWRDIGAQYYRLQITLHLNDRVYGPFRTVVYGRSLDAPLLGTWTFQVQGCWKDWLGEENCTNYSAPETF